MKCYQARLIRSALAAGLGLAMGGALLLASGGSAGAASHGATITLYNGQHVQTTAALVTAFEQETGIAVSMRSDTESTLTDQILAEGSHSPADVIYTENSPALEELQSKGLLAPVPTATLARTPAKYDSPRGDWVGVSARVSVLVYNTSMVKKAQLPTSVLQLADSKWKGKLALAPGETDFQPIVTSVDRAEGAKATLRWLDALKANAAGHIYPDNETITSEVNSGQAAIGVINQYYWYRLRAQLGAGGMHSAIAYFAPRDPGYVVDVSGAGVLRSSPHKADAERFLAFLVSPQAQRIIAHSDSFEYPIAKGAPAQAAETPFAQLEPNRISISQLGTGSTAVHLLQEAQLL